MEAEKKLDVKRAVGATFAKAIDVQYPLAVENVARLRRVHPDKSPDELIAYLSKFYVGAVSATGAGAGAAAVVPNGWVQVPAALADLASFLEASVFYTLSVAEIHGVHAEDAERRRLLVMSVLVGDTAAKKVLEPVLGKVAPIGGKQW